MEIIRASDPIPITKERGKKPVKENRITEIRQAVKDPHRVNVFVDNKFSFSLMLAELADSKIKVGDILAPERLEELKNLSNLGKLYQREVEYACTRPHSEKEIRDHLNRKKLKRALDQKRYDEFTERLKNDADYRELIKEKRAKHKEAKERQAEREKAKLEAGDFGPSYAENNTYEYSGGPRLNLPTKPGAAISDSDIDYIIERLKHDHILDDEMFAKYFVENRYILKGISNRRLTQELKKKGIDDLIIQKVLSENEYGEKPRDDAEEIDKLIERKFRRVTTADLEDEKAKNDFKQKTLAYLMRQGFEYDLAKSKIEQKIENLN